MKISKSRLLQIIREEVELHENTFDINEYNLSELTNAEEKQAIENEIQLDKEAGNLEETNLENTTAEDQILTVQKPHKVISPEKDVKKLEIKIR